jgi:peptidoglycan hydrolase-like protein with peptidoglycan-binding domain
MSTVEQRLQMAAAIVNFEARRDSKGHLQIYNLPPGDGGGQYEVAGINERYNKETCDALVGLIKQQKFAEAEALATDFIAQDTDRASSWSDVAGLEFYFRDCVFNRGAGGAVRILQRALSVSDDGVLGPATRAALAVSQQDANRFIVMLRAAREDYERNVVGRDETSEFWKGLVNRWNNAIKVAKRFPMTSQASVGALLSVPTEAGPSVPTPGSLPAVTPAVLPAIQVGMSGPRVAAWQTFLRGRGFEPGQIDGVFGEATRDATTAFQTKYKLEEDGVAGRQTLLKAAALGFELIEEPAGDNTSSNFPPRPLFQPLVTSEQRAALFGRFTYVPTPTIRNREAIKILGTWEAENIVSIEIPQLRKALGAKGPKSMAFHRLAATQLQGLWAEWESAKLLDRILTYDGSFNPRFVRGSRTSLSNHAFGTAFDINEPYNKLGHRPALVGQKGSVRELVPIANKWGFYWGGHYHGRPDGMHFEVAFLKK